MNVSQIVTAIVASHASQRPLMIWGKPGIGKSDAVRHAARQLGRKYGKKGGRVLEYGQSVPTVDADGNAYELDEAGQPVNADGVPIVKCCIGVHDVRISTCDLVELGGLIRDSGHDTMDRLCPDWWPHEGRDDLPDYGIVFLDEIPSGSRNTQAAAYQPMQDRVIAAKKLKSGWSVVGAGNRLSDGGVVNPMPTPLANRMRHVTAESDPEGWDQWAFEHNMPLELMAFIRYRPELLNTFDEYVKKKMEGMAFATERSWHMVGDDINSGMPEDILYEMVTGTVGKGPGTEFMAFRQIWKDMVDPQEILIDPQGAPVPDKASAQYAIATALASRATPDNMDAVVTYFDRLPPSMSVLGVKDVQRKDRKCTKTKAFQTWARNNAELLQ